MNKKKALSSGELYRKYGIVIIMIILFVASAVINHNFLKPQNLLNILKQISVVTIIACGETMLIVSGMIDLSAGFLCTTSACVSAGVLASTGHLSLALLVGIVIGCVCGWINGFLITYYKLQPFIATLSTMTIGRGFAQVYSNGKPYTISDLSFKVIGQGYFLGIPVPIILLVIFCIIGLVILTMTTFGRYVFAIGGNMNAAKLSGVRTQRVQLMVYVMSSICAWMVGLILAARISSGQPTAGESYEMDAIAATAIGGTSMSGGIGSLSGTIIGFVILGLLQNSMNLMNINSFWQQIVKGLLIIIAVFLDMRTKGKKA